MVAPPERNDDRMRHRHLEDMDGGLLVAAIDDVVKRGGMEDWNSLARIAKSDPATRAKILGLVAKTVKTSEFFDRPSFWIRYRSHVSVEQNAAP